jgi:hypothetical protein
MMRRLIVVVKTAVIEVTMVLMVSSGPVGWMMNQNRTLMRFTRAMVA